MTPLPDFFNSPHEIEYKDESGKSTIYKLKQLNKGQEARFARWLEKRARDDAARAIQDMPPDAAEAYTAGTRRDIAAGTYEFGGAASVQALRSPPGQVYAIFLSLEAEHPDMTLELAEKIYAQRRQEIVDRLTKAVEGADPGFLQALRSLLNLTEGRQSPSAIPPSTGSRGKSSKRRKKP